MNVSRARGPQSEVAVALSPADPEVLLAGSNNSEAPLTQVYSSTDGGLSWTSDEGPPLPFGWGGDDCASDPSPGIDATGREYFAYLAVRACDSASRIVVAARAGPGEPWEVSPPLDPQIRTEDDKPWLVVDDEPDSPHRGRVYASWTRIFDGSIAGTLVSHSDDRGRTWSAPVEASDVRGRQIWSTLAVGRRGVVYLAWIDSEALRIVVDRAPDGERFGPDRTAAGYSTTARAQCVLSGDPIPAQQLRCVPPTPTLSADTSGGPFDGRVYLTYGDRGPNGGQDVWIVAFDAQLRPVDGDVRVTPRRIVPPEPLRRASDQFLPVSALDRSDGTLWTCFYETGGDTSRRSALFSCTTSRDGGRTWGLPRPVAAVRSNEAVPGADASQYGDYAGLAVADGIAHPIWTDSRELGARGEEIYTRRVSRGR